MRKNRFSMHVLNCFLEKNFLIRKAVSILWLTRGETLLKMACWVMVKVV